MPETNFAHQESDLITPEESAMLMSRRAGYNITSDYIKQLRLQGKIKPAKQLKRTTLYERTEIEQAPLPKRHRAEALPLHDFSLDTNRLLLENHKEIPTWRELLAEIIADPYERQRISDTLNIHPITLNRWVNRESVPRLDNIRALVATLPSNSHSLIKILEKDFPELLLKTSTNVNIQLEIPSSFYENILRIATTYSETTRSTIIIDTILKKILEHFDSGQSNTMAFIARCVPPSDGGKVRSMYLTQGKENINNHHNIEYKTQFLGIESLAGFSLSTSSPRIVSTYEILSILYSSPPLSLSIGCAAAWPIVRGNHIAGCLYIANNEENHFPHEYIDFIQKYTNLLTLAFSENEFYHIDDIDLAIMPPYNVQHPYLITLQQQINDNIIHAHDFKKIFTRSQAERKVLKDLEIRLINMSYLEEKEIET